jgi:peptide/nickel transport system ATP-binding protein
LLSAVPTVDETGVTKIRLEGDVPSPVNPPRGCHFHTRCPEVFADCAATYPDETDFTPTHACRCFLYRVEEPTPSG